MGPAHDVIPNIAAAQDAECEGQRGIVWGLEDSGWVGSQRGSETWEILELNGGF